MGDGLIRNRRSRVGRMIYARAAEEYVWGIPVPGALSGVRDWPTLGEVAQRHGIDTKRMRAWAEADHLADRRRVNQAAIQVVVERERASLAARSRVLVDAYAHKASADGIRLVSDRLAEMLVAEAERRMAKDDPDADAYALTGVDGRELKALAEAGVKYVELSARAAHEQPMIQITGTLEVEDYRLRLERDDPRRLHTLLEVLQRAALPEIVEGEVVEDSDEPEPDG